MTRSQARTHCNIQGSRTNGPPNTAALACKGNVEVVRNVIRVIYSRKLYSTYLFYVLVCPEGAETEMKFHWREGGIEA